MAVRNEAAFIRDSLSSVLTQDYRHDRMEVVIADGMSSDRTRAVIDEVRQCHLDLPVQVLENPGLTVSKGLNLAIRNSRGAVVVRVDGHTQIATDYVRKCVSVLLSTGADNVGGPMRPVGSGSVGGAIAVATSSWFGVGGARFHYSARHEWVDTVYLGAWRREIFGRCGTAEQAVPGNDSGHPAPGHGRLTTPVGGFDEFLRRNQDDEFNYRLRQLGGRILLSPLIRSTYANRNSLAALFRQYFEYGLWKVRVFQVHPRQMRPRQFAPPALVAALAGSGLLSVFAFQGRVLFGTVAGSYLLANLSASAWTGRRRPIRQSILLPAVFATLHLSYGIGFLSGLVVFRRAWVRRERTSLKDLQTGTVQSWR
jgi:glycosyltransferase involved in cell wall biosynthesis